MLKSTYWIQLGLVGALAVPALDRPGASLEQALAETEKALAELVGRQGRAAEPDYSTVERALASTEPALEGARRRDELLEHLRQDLGRLQEELDELEVHGPTRAQAPAAVPAAGTSSQEAAAAPSAPRTGLDDELREQLRTPPPAFSGHTPRNTAAEPRAAARASFEAPGYSADPVRQGRALFRAGRYAEGLALLERREGTPEADYWRARSLERLSRLDEALRLYQQICERDPESPLGQRAAYDRDFVAWQVSFERRLAERRKQ